MITQDIKSPWLNIVRRLQSVARNNNGIAVINIKVVIDERGNPICWIEPQMTKIEPKGCAQKIVNLLCDG